MKHFIIVIIVGLLVTLCFRSIPITWKFDGHPHLLEVGAISIDQPKYAGAYKDQEMPPK